MAAYRGVPQVQAAYHICLEVHAPCASDPYENSAEGFGTHISVKCPQVRTNAAHNMCGHTFYVMDANGSAPQRSTVEAACAHVGGQLMEPSSDPAPLSSSGTISFSFMGQQWSSSWGGSAGTAPPCCCL